MAAYRSLAQRFVLAAGLAITALGGAALPAPAAGVDPVTVAPHPVTSAPLSGGSSTITPSLSAIIVHAGGTQASIEFTSSEPVSAKITAKPTSAAVAIPDPVLSPGTLGVIGAGLRAPVTGVSVSNAPLPPFETAHSVQLTNLKSNTAYDVTISGQTQSGAQLSGQAHFTTLKQRVLIYLDTIDVSSTGALFGDGSTTFIFGVNWRHSLGNEPTLSSGSANACFPNDGSLCQYGGFGIGTHNPTNNRGRLLAWVFAEENFDFMPTVFALAGEADTQNFFDDINLTGFSGPPIAGGPRAWQVPQDVESLSTSMSVSADHGNDSSDFQSKATFRLQVFYDNDSYPAAKRNAPVSSW